MVDNTELERVRASLGTMSGHYFYDWERFTHRCNQAVEEASQNESTNWSPETDKVVIPDNIVFSIFYCGWSAGFGRGVERGITAVKSVTEASKEVFEQGWMDGYARHRRNNFVVYLIFWVVIVALCVVNFTLLTALRQR
jgi:hypothetical protein